MGIPLPVMVIGWIAIIADITGVLVPQNDNIGHFAHLGGYFAVTVLVFLLSQQEKKKMLTGLIINVAFAVLAYLVYLQFPFLFSFL